MKITRLETTDLRVPIRGPFGDSRLRSSTVDWLFVETQTIQLTKLFGSATTSMR